MSTDENKANYLYYKKHGICPQCGKNKSAPNRVRCEECLAKNAESRKRRFDNSTQEQKEKEKKSHRMYLKSRRERMKKEGLCVWCGKPVTRNSVFCIDCKIKNQKNNEKRKCSIDRAERPLYGMCYRCGKKELVSGKKLCQKCLEASMKSLEFAKTSTRTAERMAYIRQQNNAIFCRKK